MPTFEVNKDDLKSSKLSFDINDVDVSIVNAIRRVILAEVPSVGFSFEPNGKDSDIKITLNTGSLHNEFLAHRISLVPLHFKSEIVENYVPKKYKFVLKAKNNTSEMLEITTKDFKIFDGDRQYPPEFHDEIFPANPITGDHILITKLKPNLFDQQQGDELSLEAYASVNIGKVHSRWTPVSLCVFYNNIDKDARETGFKKYKKDNENLMKDVSDEELWVKFNTLEQYRYFKMNKYNEPNSFHFQLESECGLTPAYIFKTSIEVIIRKLKKFMDDLDNENDNITIEQPKDQYMYYIKIKGEDHTLGNLIQSMFYNMFIRKDNDPDETGNDVDVSYIGYFKPHPLEDSVLIKIRTEDKSVQHVMKTGTSKIINRLQHMLGEWNSATATK